MGDGSDLSWAAGIPIAAKRDVARLFQCGHLQDSYYANNVSLLMPGCLVAMQEDGVRRQVVVVVDEPCQIHHSFMALVLRDGETVLGVSIVDIVRVDLIPKQPQISLWRSSNRHVSNLVFCVLTPRPNLPSTSNPRSPGQPQ